nr:MAG TPA: hypothetical protein [Caudoviricetes sp.]
MRAPSLVVIHALKIYMKQFLLSHLLLAKA